MTPDTQPEDTTAVAAQRRHDLLQHVAVYAAVNAVLWAVWALAGGGFAWPLFPTLGWGVGLALNAREAYARSR